MTSGPYGGTDQSPPPSQPGWPPTDASGAGSAFPPPYQGTWGPAQPYPYPGVYGYPQPRNGPGTAGLVLGIIGIVLCWALWVGWLLNLLAIIFGGVGIGRANHGQATNKNSAVAGLVLGIVGLAVGIVLWAGLNRAGVTSV